MSNCVKAGLPIDVKSVRETIRLMVNMGAEEVWLIGSRSPLKTSRTPHEGSDWDLVVVRDNPLLKVPNPRKMGWLCADINYQTHIDKLLPNVRDVAVMLYPKDTYNILNGR